MKLSGVVLTKNEEKSIERCIVSLKFCDEVIVVDDGSTDKTVEIAKKLDAKVYKRKLLNNFASQRNFGLEKAKGDWVLFIDADEVVPDKLKSEILSAIESKRNISGYYLKRYDLIWGKMLTHGEVGSVLLLRLAKKGTGKWSRKVHEIWNVHGRLATLKTPLLHYPHQSLDEFIDETNFKSSLHAKANMEEGKNSNLIKVIFWPVGKFVKYYIFKMGFLDGTEGFVDAMVMSFHSFLSWGKLWVLQKKKH